MNRESNINNGLCAILCMHDWGSISVNWDLRLNVKCLLYLHVDKYSLERVLETLNSKIGFVKFCFRRVKFTTVSVVSETSPTPFFGVAVAWKEDSYGWRLLRTLLGTRQRAWRRSRLSNKPQRRRQSMTSAPMTASVSRFTRVRRDVQNFRSLIIAAIN